MIPPAVAVGSGRHGPAQAPQVEDVSSSVFVNASLALFVTSVDLLIASTCLSSFFSWELLTRIWAFDLSIQVFAVPYRPAAAFW